MRTRFVVDIVTGTSAGGINGVFLAKALATDRDIAALSDLWVREGDIDLRVRDVHAVWWFLPHPAAGAPYASQWPSNAFHQEKGAPPLRRARSLALSR